MQRALVETQNRADLRRRPQRNAESRCCDFSRREKEAHDDIDPTGYRSLQFALATTGGDKGAPSVEPDTYFRTLDLSVVVSKPWDTLKLLGALSYCNSHDCAIVCELDFSNFDKDYYLTLDLVHSGAFRAVWLHTISTHVGQSANRAIHFLENRFPI